VAVLPRATLHADQLAVEVEDRDREAPTPVVVADVEALERLGAEPTLEHIPLPRFRVAHEVAVYVPLASVPVGAHHAEEADARARTRLLGHARSQPRLQLADHAAAVGLDELDAVGVAQPPLGVGGRYLLDLGDEADRVAPRVAAEAVPGGRLDVHRGGRTLVTVRVPGLEAGKIDLASTASQSCVAQAQTIDHVGYVDAAQVDHGSLAIPPRPDRSRIPYASSP
jgi:hypothetical protein